MAYGVTVSAIDNIPGKDRIGLFHFKENDYTVIGMKDIKVGEAVVYFEVDAILPVEKRFEFLAKRCYNERCQGYLIKKMKMGGVYSFGLVMSAKDLGMDSIEAGKDYSEILNVRKDEDRLDASPDTFNISYPKKWKWLKRYAWGRWLLKKLFAEHKKQFPTELLSKSDEDNLMNDPTYLDRIKEGKYFTSIKLEGKSMTIVPMRTLFGGVKLVVYGRNIEGDKDMYAYAKTLLPAIKKLPHDWILQGEFCDPKVQKGIYQNGTHFYIYNVVKNRVPLSPEEYRPVLKKVGLETVPYIDLDLNKFVDTQELYSFVDKFKFLPGMDYISVYHDDVPEGAKFHEGIVVRNSNYSVHFKVKNREYSLKQDE